MIYETDYGSSTVATLEKLSGESVPDVDDSLSPSSTSLPSRGVFDAEREPRKEGERDEEVAEERRRW